MLAAEPLLRLDVSAYRVTREQLLPFVIDVSPSGRYTAVATPETLTLWDAHAPDVPVRWSSAHTGDALAVRVEDDGSAVAVRSTGWRQQGTAAGSVEETRLIALDGPDVLAAATLGEETTVAATAAGRIFWLDEDGARSLAPEGALRGAFAIVLDEASERVAVATPEQFALIGASDEPALLAHRSSIGGLYVADAAFLPDGGVLALTSAGEVLEVLAEPVPFAQWVPVLAEARTLAEHERVLWGSGVEG